MEAASGAKSLKALGWSGTKGPEATLRRTAGPKDRALARAMKTTDGGDDFYDRAHWVECESSCNPLCDVKIWVCPRTISRNLAIKGYYGANQEVCR